MRQLQRHGRRTDTASNAMPSQVMLRLGVLLLLIAAVGVQAAPAVVAAPPPPLPLGGGRLSCSLAGECEACPPEIYSTDPACRLYGNRRLLMCIDDVDDDSQQQQSTAAASNDEDNSNTRSKAFPSYEPCARAIEAERKDFWEFVLTNLCFATAALFIVVIRGRIIAARHYTQLVNLIGVSSNRLNMMLSGAASGMGAGASISNGNSSSSTTGSSNPNSSSNGFPVGGAARGSSSAGVPLLLSGNRPNEAPV